MFKHHPEKKWAKWYLYQDYLDQYPQHKCHGRKHHNEKHGCRKDFDCDRKKQKCNKTSECQGRDQEDAFEAGYRKGQKEAFKRAKKFWKFMYKEGNMDFEKPCKSKDSK